MNIPFETPEVLIHRRKQRFGLFYGIVAGLAFSLTLWGIDGWMHAQAYAYYPYARLLSGAPLAMAVCGVAGWLTSHLEKPLVGVFLWELAAGALAWLTLLVPIVLAPAIMQALDPDLQTLLHYGLYDNSGEKAAVAFGWIAVSAFITAAIQVPMVEQATFSTSVFGKIAPHLICGFLMLVSGGVADTLNNQPLRDPLLSMSNTIDYALAHQDGSGDPKMSRQLHVSSLRPVQAQLSEERRLVVGWFDPLLENVNILINFNGNWVECSTISNIPLNCSSVSP